MKISTCVSVLGALLLANIPLTGTAENIDRLIDKCKRNNSKECKELQSIVSSCKLTDQTRLARIALEQFGSIYYFLNLDAVGCLTDQPLLAKIVTMASEPDVRAAAVLRLTDHNMLARIAIESKVGQVSSAAVRSLTTDQASLANIAIGAQGRAADQALESLTDQAKLAKIALAAGDVGAMRISNYHNEDLLKRVAFGDYDPVTRAEAVSKMDPSDPVLKRIAAFGQDTDFSPITSLARVKLAIQEPLILNRLPRIWFSAEISRTSQAYQGGPGLLGEQISVELTQVSAELSQGEKELAKGSWETHFPDVIDVQDGPSFLSANVLTDGLLLELFRSGQFTQSDLAGLASSENPIVRSAAVAGLTDQALLAKAAVSDGDSWVRVVAVRNLTDREVLARIAAEGRNSSIRLEASARLRQLQNGNNPLK